MVGVVVQMPGSSEPNLKKRYKEGDWLVFDLTPHNHPRLLRVCNTFDYALGYKEACMDLNPGRSGLYKLASVKEYDTLISYIDESSDGREADAADCKPA